MAWASVRLLQEAVTVAGQPGDHTRFSAQPVEAIRWRTVVAAPLILIDAVATAVRKRLRKNENPRWWITGDSLCAARDSNPEPAS